MPKWKRLESSKLDPKFSHTMQVDFPREENLLISRGKIIYIARKI